VDGVPGGVSVRDTTHFRETTVCCRKAASGSHSGFWDCYGEGGPRATRASRFRLSEAKMRDVLHGRHGDGDIHMQLSRVNRTRISERAPSSSDGCELPPHAGAFGRGGRR
jgi:hypothetical protein